MKINFFILITLVFCLISCGKSGSKKTPLVDTTSIDTAGVDQLEKELKDLEAQSARVHEKLDSINKTIDE